MHSTLTDQEAPAPVAADALVAAITDRLSKFLDTKSLDLLADAVAERINAGVAADIAARLRVDALAGDDLILSRSEAARFIGRSVKTLELWASRGIGPKMTQVGPRAIGYRVGDIREFARDRAIGTEALARMVAAPASKN